MLIDKNKIRINIHDLWGNYESPKTAKTIHINNFEELYQYIKDNNIDPEEFNKAIFENSDISYNILGHPHKENEREEEEMKNSNSNDEILNMYRDIKAENKIIYNKIETTRWLLTVLITVFGIFTPLMFSIHARSIDAKFESINTNINSKFELIEQQLQSQKEINQLQIERDVSKEFLNHKK